MRPARRLSRAMHMQRRDGRLLQQETDLDTEGPATVHVDPVSSPLGDRRKLAPELIRIDRAHVLVPAPLTDATSR